MGKLFTMYVLTDPHYLSKELWVPGKPIIRRERGDQIALRASPEILDTFFDMILEDKDAEAVLITGDLVNAGEVISHRDFKAQLKKLTSAGKKVFVTTATHDYCGCGEDGDENIFHAVGYGENECYSVEYINRKALYHLYDDYGPDSADSIHDESGSYSAVIGDGVRLIALNDNGNGRSCCGLSDSGFEWVREELKKAKNAGECVFLAVHHPVLPPWDIYKLVASFEMFGGSDKLCAIMCEEGAPLIFTGHTHVHNIRKYTDTEGRFFYDVSTTALCAAKGMMRKVELDTETRRCSITSVGIEKIKGLDTPLSAFEYIYGLNFTGLLQKLVSLAAHDWNAFIADADGFLSTEKLEKHRLAVKAAAVIAQNLKMSVPARFAKKYNGLTKEEIKKLRSVRVIDCAFVIMRHVFRGNAPYTPDTVEYKVFNGVCEKADKILNAVHKPIGSFIKGASSIAEIARPFLYNNRTGNDDNLELDM